MTYAIIERNDKEGKKRKDYVSNHFHKNSNMGKFGTLQ